MGPGSTGSNLELGCAEVVLEDQHARASLAPESTGVGLDPANGLVLDGHEACVNVSCLEPKVWV